MLDGSRRPKSRTVAPVSRRSFLRASLAGTALLLPAWPRIVLGAAPRTLAFDHMHTGEKLTVAYWAGGKYVPEALDRLNHLLRDHYSDAIYPIDPQLFDLLHEVRASLGSRGRFQVVSGYRSPATNRMLRARSRGVARSSLHMTGQALDLRLLGSATWRVRETAVALQRGGVGYYGRANFVHLDTGQVRTWRG